MTDFFEIGRVLKPQGIAGEVKLEPYTDTLERFFNLHNVFFKDGQDYNVQTVEKVRVDNKYAYIKFLGINDRESAEKLRGFSIYVDRDNAAPLAPGTYYIADLIGMKVCYDDGECIGSLTDILQTGAADIYNVKLSSGSMLSFPSVEGVITDRDIRTGKLVISRNRIKEVGIYGN